MADIRISKFSESTVFIHTSNPKIDREIDAYFTVLAPNHMWDPRFKNGWWDGKIRLYKDSRLPIGLIEEVYKFAKGGQYSVECEWERFLDLSAEDFRRFTGMLGLPAEVKPRAYQMNAAYDAITKKHISLEIPTSGGKTLVSYLIVRQLLAMNKKILMIVPNTSLVEQTYGDWEEYGWKGVWESVHRIYGGQKKVFDSPVIVSTWQSLYRDLALFQKFDAILIDEAHGAKAKMLKKITEACINADYRIGMSGTYPEPGTADYFTIVGALGPIKNYIGYQEMADKGWIAKLRIYGITLKYPLSYRRQMRDFVAEQKRIESNTIYQEETDLIHNHPERNNFIGKLVQRQTKNCLILFTKREMHGDPLQQYLTDLLPERKVIYVTGSTKTMDRELVRKMAEAEDNLVICATYGTFSTGINIKNLHSVIFASGYKSKFKVLQSIGRGLRKMKNKDSVTVFDLIDDCRLKTKGEKAYVNYSMKHSDSRKELYQKHNFDYKSISYDIKG